MVLASPLISNSFSSFTKPLGSVSNVPILIGTTVTILLLLLLLSTPLEFSTSVLADAFSLEFE